MVRTARNEVPARNHPRRPGPKSRGSVWRLESASDTMAGDSTSTCPDTAIKNARPSHDAICNCASTRAEEPECCKSLNSGKMPALRRRLGGVGAARQKPRDVPAVYNPVKTVCKRLQLATKVLFRSVALNGFCQDLFGNSVAIQCFMYYSSFAPDLASVGVSKFFQ